MHNTTIATINKNTNIKELPNSEVIIDPKSEVTNISASTIASRNITTNKQPVSISLNQKVRYCL